MPSESCVLDTCQHIPEDFDFYTDADRYAIHARPVECHVSKCQPCGLYRISTLAQQRDNVL
jgi:hypothetical protein